VAAIPSNGEAVRTLPAKLYVSRKAAITLFRMTAVVHRNMRTGHVQAVSCAIGFIPFPTLIAWTLINDRNILKNTIDFAGVTRRTRYPDSLCAENGENHAVGVASAALKQI